MPRPASPAPVARGRRRRVPAAVVACLLAGAVLVVAAGLHASPGRAVATGATPAAHGGPLWRTPLAGAWTVRDDPRAVGTSLGWQRGRFGGRTVRLPFSPNARTITYSAGRRNFAGSVAWYRTTVDVERTGTYAIRFESVNHRAQVWVDGRRAATHVGQYEPFEVRRTLTKGRHTLVVRADFRNPARMKREGWHRLWFNYGGINREVTIRPLGASEVEAPRVRTELQADGSARVSISASVVNRGARRAVQLAGLLRHGETDVPFGFDALDLAPGERRRVGTTVVVKDPQLWAPGSPALHDLTLAVPGESGWYQRIGLREVSRSGRTLLLNGKPLQLRGASLHEDVPGVGDALRPQDMDALVGDLKSIGANATRAQHPLSPALLERLDAAGIVVWQGVGPTDSPGAWSAKTPAMQRRARERVRISTAQMQPHPSIIVWNLVNEVQANGRTDGLNQYVKASVRGLKVSDPGRLIALDLWGKYPPRRAGSVYDGIDAIGLTKYLGWYEAPNTSAARLRTNIRRFTAASERAFPDRILAVTEFGAEGNRQNPSATPGGLGYQERLLRTSIAAYAELPSISGTLVWNLRDFGVSPTFGGGSINRVLGRQLALVPGLNQKGLFTYAGREKPAVPATRRALAEAAELAAREGRTAY